MNSIKKQLKNIIKEAILAAMDIRDFDKLHQEIDNVAGQMNEEERARLLRLLALDLSEFTGKNHLLNRRVNPANN